LKRERLVEAMDLLEGEGMWKRSGTGDKRKILDEVFDERTLKALHKLMNAGILQTLDFPVATGKEATVFVGLTKKADEVAVKVYRVGNATFNSIRRYIQDDPRFKAVGRDRRSVIFAWAVKEYKNLLRMHEAGVTVPSPVAHLENVLVMEYLFVGDGHEPAPSLKGARGFDAFLRCFDKGVLIRTTGDIIALGYEEATVRWVVDAVDRSEYKRRQAPPGLKITTRAFGKDRRMPITNRFRG